MYMRYNSDSSTRVYNVVIIPYMLLLFVAFCTALLVLFVAYCCTAAAVYRGSNVYQVYILQYTTVVGGFSLEVRASTKYLGEVLGLLVRHEVRFRPPAPPGIQYCRRLATRSRYLLSARSNCSMGRRTQATVRCSYMYVYICRPALYNSVLRYVCAYAPDRITLPMYRERRFHAV